MIRHYVYHLGGQYFWRTHELGDQNLGIRPGTFSGEICIPATCDLLVPAVEPKDDFQESYV